MGAKGRKCWEKIALPSVQSLVVVSESEVPPSGATRRVGGRESGSLSISFIGNSGLAGKLQALGKRLAEDAFYTTGFVSRSGCKIEHTVCTRVT